MSIEVTILGAGVAGLAVAHELTVRGAHVRIIDPEGGPGPGGCSWWAGGMLAPHCEGETAEEPVVRLGAGAAAWWRAAGVDVTRAGALVLALSRDRGELERFARRTSEHERIGAEMLGQLEPALAGRYRAALHFPDEAHLAPRAALATLRDSLVARGIEVAPDGEAQGAVIDCRGLAARDRLPGLRGVRGEMAILRAPEVILRRTLRLLHPRHPLYLVPRGDGVYMLGATQIESDGRGPPTLRSVAEMLNAAYALHPAFAEAEVLEFGANARPAFADNLPRIVREGGRIHVNGLFRHGFLLAPALARMAAALVLNGEQSEFVQ